MTLGSASGLGSSCAVEIGGTCFTAPFTPTPMTKAECEAQKSDLGIKECCTEYGCNNKDYWAGAVKQCGGVSKMPTMAQLAELASQLYVGNPSIGAKERKEGIQFDSNSSTAKALGLTPTPHFWLWAGEEYSPDHGYDRFFYTTISGYGNARRNSDGQAVCVGE